MIIYQYIKIFQISTSGSCETLSLIIYVPFYVPLFGMLILLSVCPAVGTWLPSLLI